jgi:hypothetical protein
MEAEKLANALNTVPIDDGIQQDFLQQVQSARETTVGLLRQIANAFSATEQTNETQTSKRRGRRNA